MNNDDTVPGEALMDAAFDEQEQAISLSKEALMGLLAESADDEDGGEGVFDPGDDTITLHK